MSKDKPKRKPGRPKKADKPIGPDELLEIERLWLMNTPHNIIGARFGVTERTIRHYVETHFKPLWKARAARSVDEDLAKVDLLEDVSWPAAKEGDRDAQATIKWAIEHRAKCAGHYAAQKMDLKVEGEVRFAGIDPDELTAEMLAELQADMEKIKRMRGQADGE